MNEKDPDIKAGDEVYLVNTEYHEGLIREYGYGPHKIKEASLGGYHSKALMVKIVGWDNMWWSAWRFELATSKLQSLEPDFDETKGDF